ncbi:LutC/YkgG family protein [Mucilaginibacter sp.]
MNTRDKILSAVNQNQPAFVGLPDIDLLKGDHTDLTAKFINTITAIGGKVVTVKSIADVRYYLLKSKVPDSREITTVPLLGDIMELITSTTKQTHSLENVDYAIIEANFAVAENGAVWVTEDRLFSRVLPFICQYLAVIVNAQSIVPTMHEAYANIGNDKYGFGTFIAGPSKTADIEQSLVLGAHGPRTMTVFLIE